MRIAARLARAADLAGAAIFGALFLAVIVQVGSRFVLDAPAAWTEELAAIAFVWTVFWGAAFCVPLSAHVAVDLVPADRAPRARRLLHALGLAVLALCFGAALPGIFDYLHFVQRERTPVLDVPLGTVYSVFLAFALMVVVRALAGIVRPAPPTGAPPAKDGA